MKRNNLEEKWSRLFAAKRYDGKPVTLSQEEQIEILEDFKTNVGFDALIENVRRWADDKGLIKIENAPKQVMKVNEEFGEFCSAVIKGYSRETKDGAGDTFVTLIILCFQLRLDPTECLEFAWDEIKNRTGKTIGGTFIKD